MEGIPNEFSGVETPEYKMIIAREVYESLARTEIEFAIINLCNYLKSREESGYIQTSTPDSVYSIRDAITNLEDSHKKEPTPFEQLEEYFQQIQLGFEQFMDKPQTSYSNDDLDSIREVIFKLRDIQERLFDLIQDIKSADESPDKEFSAKLRQIIERIRDLVEEKGLRVEKLANLYEEYISRP
jgi:uncharacterized protein (UPF0305 family)